MTVEGRKADEETVMSPRVEMNRQNTVSVLGYSVYAGSRDYFADGVKGVVATLNPHSYVIARRDDAVSRGADGSRPAHS